MILKTLAQSEEILEVFGQSLKVHLAVLDPLSNDVIGELIRAAAMMLSTKEASYNSSHPFYISELINVVRDQLSGLMRAEPPKTEEGEIQDVQLDRLIRSVVNLLEDLGDLAELPNGYWMPTPLRFVRIGASAKAVILGSATVSSIQRETGCRIEVRGLSRFVDIQALPSAMHQDDDIWQDFDDWLGERPSDLTVWLASYFNYAQANLKTSASDFTDFEIYDPQFNFRNPQYFRWISSGDFKGDVGRLHLCRLRQSRFRGVSSYWIAQLVSGRGSDTRMMREFPIPSRDVRRLQYAIDLRDSCPTSAEVREKSNFSEVTLKSWLPGEGMRMLASLGTECSLKLGRLPLSYKFERAIAPVISSYLNYLGIRLDTREKNDG